MQLIQQVANNLDPTIKVTFDAPSLNADKRVPILDVKANINDKGKIEYIFYKKPMASRLGTLKSSAYSMRNKITILTQECFRRLHNTSESVSDDKKVEILNEFMIDLKLSGYNEKERKNILTCGINTYNKLRNKETLGIRSFYRSYEEQKKYRHDKKDKVNNWFRKGKQAEHLKTVVFVTATPGDKLLKMIKETESKHRVSDEFRIKFVSKAGTKLKNVLQRKSIREKTCEDKDGRPCVTSDGEGIKTHKCMQNRINYFAKCKTCAEQGKLSVYYGETARNLHVRSREHYSGLERECRHNFMYRHIQSEHDGQNSNV